MIRYGATAFFILLSAAASGAEILRVAPSVVSSEGGTRMTFTGSGFEKGDIPRIEGVPLTRVTFESAKVLTGVSPEMAPGLYSAEVVAGRGTVKATLRRAVTVEAPSDDDAALEKLRASSLETPLLKFRSGAPAFVGGRFPAAGADPYQRSSGFLRRNAQLFGLSDPDLDFAFRRAVEGDHDTVHYKQTYRGIPVHGGSLTVGLAGQEVLFAMSKLLLPGKRIDVIPRIRSSQAEDLARKALGLNRGALGAETSLKILDLGLLLDGPRDPKLVWQVTLGRRHAQRVFIDAHRGTVVLRYPLSQENGGSLHGFDMDLEDAEEEAEAADTECYLFASNPNVATESSFNSDYLDDVDAQVANSGMRATYRFFHENMNWHSYDNDSSLLEVYIHSTTKGGGAWSPACDLIQLQTGRPNNDTLCHELTHGIIGETSDLEYEFQSGALNEHYADAMAMIADRMREGASADWTHAEDRTSGDGPVRDFRDPSRSLPDPCSSCGMQSDHYDNLNYRWDPATEEYIDNGGVHFNSGIANKAMFLMVEGGSFGGFLAPGGLSLSKIRRVKWLALQHLPEDARFSDAAYYEIWLAKYYRDHDMFNFDNEDVCSFKVAWAAVGVADVDDTCNGVPTKDTDGDAVPDFHDNCPTNRNSTQKDLDGDLHGDACDTDKDGDGVPNSEDTCPTKYNPLQGPCWDFDNDGWSDLTDNCPFDPNPTQKDTDNDGEGDACEYDGDLDGVNVPEDNCPLVPNTNQQDQDGDHFGDACDVCPTTADPVWAFGLDGQPYQPDSDDDGIPDACDNTYRVEGTSGLPLFTEPGREPVRVEIEGVPGSRFKIPLEICPDGCPEWWAPALAFDLDLSGLPAGILPYVTDSDGEMQARPIRGRTAQELRFRPQGGKKYFLNFELSPGYTGGKVELLAHLSKNDDPQPPTMFRRGDSNGDGALDLSDAVASLAYLFLGGPAPGCLDAADSNDDNDLDLTDGVFGLSFLFLGGMQFPNPGPENCGSDPTDSIGCDVYTNC